MLWTWERAECAWSFCKQGLCAVRSMVLVPRRHPSLAPKPASWPVTSAPCAVALSPGVWQYYVMVIVKITQTAWYSPPCLVKVLHEYFRLSRERNNLFSGINPYLPDWFCFVSVNRKHIYTDEPTVQAGSCSLSSPHNPCIWKERPKVSKWLFHPYFTGLQKPILSRVSSECFRAFQGWIFHLFCLWR